jgi:hypothetical protein
MYLDWKEALWKQKSMHLKEYGVCRVRKGRVNMIPILSTDFLLTEQLPPK